jgi:chromosome partitioning protein
VNETADPGCAGHAVGHRTISTACGAPPRLLVKTIATINFKGGVGKTTLTWCLGDVLSTYSNAKVLLFDLDAQMSLTHAIALDSEGNSSGKFSSWYDRAIKNDRNLLAVLKKFLDKDLTSFQADNGFVFRLKDNYHFVPSTEQLY